MKMYKLLKINAIAIIILGCIHLIATPFIMNGINSDIKPVFLAMFIMAGFGTILPGIVILNQLNSLKEKRKQAFNMLFICTVYFITSGIVGVSTMTGNPFAYIALLLGLILIIPLSKIFKLQKQITPK